MSTWNAEVGVWPLVWTNFMQGIGGGIILVPIQVIAFPSLEPHRRTEATAVYNLVRSIGASIGVSGALAMYVRTSSVMHAQLAEHVTPFNRALQAQGHEGWSMATTQALARLEKEISLQSAVIGYTGTRDGVAFDGGSAERMPLILGEERLIPGFEAHVVGLRPGGAQGRSADKRVVAHHLAQAATDRQKQCAKGERRERSESPKPRGRRSPPACCHLSVASAPPSHLDLLCLRARLRITRLLTNVTSCVPIEKLEKCCNGSSTDCSDRW